MLTISDRIDDLFPTPNIFNQTAKDLGISPDQLEAKIDGKDDFLQSEIKAIAKRFQLSNREILELFFPQPLQKTVIENIFALNGDEYYQIENLARLAGLEPGTLWYKVNDQQELTISELERIATVLERPAEYFLQRHF